jgi:hypothetical protein
MGLDASMRTKAKRPIGVVDNRGTPTETDAAIMPVLNEGRVVEFNLCQSRQIQRNAFSSSVGFNL